MVRSQPQLIMRGNCGFITVRASFSWKNMCGTEKIYDSKCSALEIEGRAYKPLQGSDYKLIVSFESLDPEEKIYGMGQYQQSCLNPVSYTHLDVYKRQKI